MTDRSSPGQKWSEIDTTVPHSARIWNYWLGGKDHYPVDREVGDQFSAIFPDIIAVARASTDSSLAKTCRQPWIM